MASPSSTSPKTPPFAFTFLPLPFLTPLSSSTSTAVASSSIIIHGLCTTNSTLGSPAPSPLSIVVFVNLPLALEDRLLAVYHTAFQALLRLRDATPLLSSHANFTRVFLIGDSSGANIIHELSAMVGWNEENEPRFWAPVKVTGGIAIHPGFVRSMRSALEMKLEWETPFLMHDMLDKFLALGLLEGVGKDHLYTCLMGEAAPPMEVLKMPPVMVVVVEKDLIRDTEMEYCEAMKKAGKEGEVFYQSDVGHSFYLNKFTVDEDEITGKRTKKLILAIKDFVDRHDNAVVVRSSSSY